MRDDGSAPNGAASPNVSAERGGELAELRELLVGAERRQLNELRRRLDTHEITPEEVAEHLPEAIAMRASRDRQLAFALAPTIETAISESVRRNPREIATAIFPILGPSIRKAIAEAMSGLVEAINRAVEHSFTVQGLKWRIASWRTGVPFAEIVIRNTLVYRVEQVFLVHAETGLLLGHAPEETGADANLISGMLTAIRDFITDSFETKKTGELRTFAAGDLCVLVEPGPRAYAAAVVRGQPPASLVGKLQDLLENVHARWATALAGFDGDTAPFMGTRPLLEDCLETVTARDRGAARTRAQRLAWLAPLLMIALIVAFFTVRSARRWNSAVARLEAEPGLAIVRAERSFGRWSIAGLRDPMAARPQAVLASIGVDTSSVSMRWEPYISADGPIVLERARRALSPPSSVTLRMAGDTLVAEGAADARWRERAASIAPMIAGASRVRLDGVRDGLPAPLEAIKHDVEARRIFFAIGSSALDSVATAAVSALAPQLTTLFRVAAREGYHLTVELVGRTDPLGTEEGNRMLARRRAETIATALASARSSDVVAVGLGVASPLPGKDDVERARLNRSVSVVVRAESQDSGTRGTR